MKTVIVSFFKERAGNIIGICGVWGIFLFVFYLYGIPGESVQYAMVLSVVWVVILGYMDFVKYNRQHKKVIQNEKRVENDIEGLPPSLGLLESDYQKLVQTLYEKKVELESGNRISKQEMSDYYAMWVHQIKTPIAALRVLLQTCEEECEKTAFDEKVAQSGQGTESIRMFQEMKQELFKIEQYVEMVLTYLRMDDMSGDMSFTSCSLDRLVKQAVRKYSQMFILQKIKLNYTALDKEVLTDEKWLLFVIEQILSNALKYTKQGSISIYMEKECLVIADTGIGIWPEDLPRVFERGFTGYNGRENKKSTGIGLYLCKSIMEKLHHDISIESEPGVGTKVFLDLNRKEIRVE